MDFLKTLEDNSILIIPSNIKDKILSYIDQNNLLINTKLLTFSMLKKSLYFDYDNKTINYIMNKYNVSYSIALDYIKNMYYVLDSNNKDRKITFLKDLYKELDNNKLLIKDNLFINLLKSKSKLYVYGFDYINKFNMNMLNIIYNYIKYEIINKEDKNYKHIVYKANSLEDEVIYVAEQISSLVENNIPLNKIYLAGIDDDYKFTLKRIFKAYHLPYFIKNGNVLYDTAMAKYFFNNLDKDKDTLLDSISKKYKTNINKKNKMVYDALVKLVNNFYWTNLENVKELLIEEAKKIKLPSIHMKEEIVTTNIIDNYFSDDEYVFLLNFNMNVAPIVKKDEDYINDAIKSAILETSEEENVINKDTLLKAIGNIKNITITYKMSSLFNEYLPSYLVNDYYMEEPIKIGISNYSNKINELLFAKKLDNLIKFKMDDDVLPILNNNYTIPYDTYDNQFKGINTKIDNIKYSYSNMSNYFKCPFRFYAANVLYVDEFTKTYDTFIGSLFHYILEEYLKDNNKDIDELYDNYIKDNIKLSDNDKNKYNLNYHDEYFTEKLRKEIHTIIDIINNQYSFIDGDVSSLFEHPVDTTTHKLGIETKIDAVIKGFVDKCLIINNNVLIIDYKTGKSDVIKREMFEYGLHIQLPIYMYLLEKLNPEYNVAGIYLQHILTGNTKKDKKNTQEELRIKELKLDGLTTNQEDVIKLFDNNYNKSEIITKSKKRNLSNEDKNSIKEMVSNLIKECVDNTYDANFIIKPININDKTEDGCKYCKFRDICFMKQEQYNYIYTSKEDDEDGSN